MKSNGQYKQTEIGEIPEDWSVVRLGDFSSFRYGKMPDKQLVSLEKGYPIYSGYRFNGYYPEYSSDKDKIIIVARGVGGTGDVKIAPSKTWITNLSIILDLDESEFNKEFFKYSHFDGLKYLDTGSAQSQITINDLQNLIVIKPSLFEQQQIASILTSLDDKIELNRRMNKTLEEIGKALFKRWFVDFEFPNENGEPYKSSGGEMVESKLGEIPKGWKVKTLDEVADVSIGRTPPRLQKEWFSTNPEDIKWISIKDMGNSGMYIQETAEYLTREAVQNFNIPTIPTNTVIVSFKLTVGRVAITTEEMLSNEAIAHIKTNFNKLSAEYMYLLLKKFDFSSLGTTSSIATAVNSKSIKGMELLIPNYEVLDNFNLLVKPIFRRILTNSLEISNLEILRDSLLPRLMSGKIRV